MFDDKYYSRFFKVMVFLFDFLIISLAFSLSKKLGFGLAINEEQFNAFLLIFSLCWIIAGFDKIYHLNKFTLLRTIGIQLFAILIVHVALIVGILFLIKTFSIDINFLLCVYALTIVLIIISRIAYKVLSKYFEFSGFDQRRFVIIGATQTGKSIQNFFASHAFNRYHFRGFFDDLSESQYCDKSLIKGRMKDLKDFCIKENIDEIYFALALTEKDLFEDIRKFADDNCIYLRFAPDFSSVVKDNYNLMMYDSMPILTTRKEPLGVSVNAALKRAFDIAFSLTIILTVFPFVVPIIAFAIRLNSKGPIIFKQLRPGKKNKLFECYKFRTMAVNNSAEFQATKNDPRVTSVGKFLRKTNLDELPQFVNVLLGNMSVVGPRPNMVSQLEEYSRKIDSYRVRHFVTPGITGYAQVNGYRGETREPGLMAKRVEYDVMYLENWSLSLDLKIIFLTVWNMLKGEKGAY